jgi:Multicopper oxidase
VPCSYDIDDGEICLVYYFYTLNVSSVLFREYYHHSCRLVLVLSISIPCCANINLTRYHFVSTQAPLLFTANSTLINGLGRFAGGPDSPLAVITVIPKKRYRFRLISISCDPNFIFSIDGHSLVSCLIQSRYPS